MYSDEKRERDKTITIRLTEQELEKLNLLVEQSGEKFKSDFIRKIILNEDVSFNTNKYFEKVDEKLNLILEKLENWEK